MKPAAVPTDIPEPIRLVKQTGVHGDCAVSTLAMLVGVTYEEALAAFERPASVLVDGADWGAIRKAARRLKVATRLLRTRFDLDEDTGVLALKKARADEHLVFLWEGRIIDGNGELWRMPMAYLDAYGYMPTGLLVRR